MTRHSRVVALAAALGGLALAAPARALIVWDGKIVPAWPEEARPPLPAGVALAATNIGLYAHPRCPRTLALLGALARTRIRRSARVL